MKKMYLMAIVFSIATIFNASAQVKLTNTAGTSLSETANPVIKNTGNLPTPQALWDIKFNYNASTAVGLNGYAGVAYTGTEFWLSRWASDTMYTLSPTGTLTSTFTIPGVTGVRAFTWDGQFLYAGTNTATISIINPVTKTQTGTITVANGTAVRHITYDSTANAGAGGFWIGNFATAITQIDMNGATLNSIPATTHGLAGMYGSAIDHWTAGGPYLWIFDQGGASQSQIVRLLLPSGTPTGLVHDVMSDVGVGGTGGSAGGLFITNQLDTLRTMVGLLQGTPNRLFGYELNDFILPAVDAALDTLRATNPYYQIPQTHVLPMNFTGSVRNAGANTITGTLNVDVSQAGISVFNSAPAFSNLASGTAANVTTISSYSPPAIGNYDVTGIVNVTNDVTALNDTIRFSFMTTDTVFAREAVSSSTSSLGIGNGGGGTIGQRFTTSVNDIATSVSFYLASPTMGDTVSASLYTFTNIPGTIMASTPNYIIQAADTNGTWITLPFSTGPFSLAAGNYFVGIREYSENITLGTTTFNYRPGAGWVIFGTAPWNTSEFYGFPRTYLLRLNVMGLTGLNDPSSSAIFNVYPNPTTGIMNLVSNKPIKKLTVTNILGELMYSNQQFSSHSIDLSYLNNGIYFIKAEGDNFINIQKIIVQN